MLNFASKEDEIIYLLRDNNRMLKEIIAYINLINSKAEEENNYDFLRNILANLISNKIDNNLIKLIMKKTHISARDYEILVSGQGKTLDQVINNIGSNSGNDDLVPITNITAKDLAEYAADVFKVSTIKSVLQKFESLQNNEVQDEEPTELGYSLPTTNMNSFQSLNDILTVPDYIVSLEFIYDLLAVNNIENNTIPLIIGFCIANNIKGLVSYNNSMNYISTFSDEDQYNIGSIEVGHDHPEVTIVDGNNLILTSINCSWLTASEFSKYYYTVKTNSGNTYRVNCYVDNVTKLIFNVQPIMH